MLVVGLTGSIGMGKSTAATMLRRMNLPLHDADAAVHRLLGPKGAAVPAVEAAFPGVVVEGVVDRAKLGARVFKDPAALRRLEAILHPLVRSEALSFIRCQARRRRPIAVLEIPLLFETGGDRLCDVVIVVSAPVYLQRCRVMRRPGMTEARFRAILGEQLPDAVKRRRADFVVTTGLSKGETMRQLRAIIRLLERAPERYRRRNRRAPHRPAFSTAQRRCHA